MNYRNYYFQSVKLQSDEILLWKSPCSPQALTGAVVPVCVGTALLCSLFICLVGYAGGILDRATIASVAMLVCSVVISVLFKKTFSGMESDHPYFITNKRVIVAERKSVRSVPVEVVAKAKIQRRANDTANVCFQDQKGRNIIVMTGVPAANAVVVTSETRNRLPFDFAEEQHGRMISPAGG